MRCLNDRQMATGSHDPVAIIVDTLNEPNVKNYCCPIKIYVRACARGGLFLRNHTVQKKLGLESSQIPALLAKFAL